MSCYLYTELVHIKTDTLRPYKIWAVIYIQNLYTLKLIHWDIIRIWTVIYIQNFYTDTLRHYKNMSCYLYTELVHNKTDTQRHYKNMSCYLYTELVHNKTDTLRHYKIWAVIYIQNLYILKRYTETDERQLTQIINGQKKPCIILHSWWEFTKILLYNALVRYI